MRIHMQCRSAELAGRRNLSVKPILFMSQRASGGLHSFVAAIRRVIASVLRELRTMLGAFAENFRLLHAILPQANTDMFNPQPILRVPLKSRAVLQKYFLYAPR